MLNPLLHSWSNVQGKVAVCKGLTAQIYTQICAQYSSESVHLTTPGVICLGLCDVTETLQKIFSNLNFACIFNFNTNLGLSN